MNKLTALTTLSLVLQGSYRSNGPMRPLPLQAPGLKNLLLLNEPHHGFGCQDRQPHHLSQLTGVVRILLRSTGFACPHCSVCSASFLLLPIIDARL